MGDDDSSNIRLKLGHAGSDVRSPLALVLLVALGGLRQSCVGLVAGTYTLRRDSALQPNGTMVARGFRYRS